MIDPTHDRDRELWQECRRNAGADPAGDAACPDEVTLAAWIDGRLGGEEREHLETHLAECRQCQDAVMAVAAGRDDAGDRLPFVPADVTRRARGLVRAGAGRRRAGPLAWAAAAAAAIIVSIAGFAAGSAAGPQRTVEEPVLAIAERAWSEDLLGVDPLDEPLLEATLLLGDLAWETRP